MSTAFLSSNDEDFLKSSKMKQCGIVNCTDDLQHFSLECLKCCEKFMYFDAFIEHMHHKHQSEEKSYDDFNKINESEEVFIKKEINVSDKNDDQLLFDNERDEDEVYIKAEPEPETAYFTSEIDPDDYQQDGEGDYEPYSNTPSLYEEDNRFNSNENECNYDDMVEQSLLDDGHVST